MGFQYRKVPKLAMALGGRKVAFRLPNGDAYTAFANDGNFETHFIRKIVDASGAVVVDNTKSKASYDQEAKEMTSMMLGVYNRTGKYQTRRVSSR